MWIRRIWDRFSDLEQGLIQSVAWVFLVAMVWGS